jgi:hypothetical protein
VRSAFLLIVCLACLSGCAGFRQHVADGPGDALYRGSGKAARYAPTVFVYAAYEAALSAVFGDTDDDFDE